MSTAPPIVLGSAGMGGVWEETVGGGGEEIDRLTEPWPSGNTLAW